ncbi:MAG: secretin N-terminal domain-containing protein [Candidatus Rifleibacteriota bacterium]
MYLYKNYFLHYSKIYGFFLVILFLTISIQSGGQTRVIRGKKNPFKKVPLIRNQGSANDSGSRAVAPGQKKPSVIRFNNRKASDKVKVSENIDDAEIIEPSEGNRNDSIAINFEAVDLMSLVRYLSQETGRGFIINQPLSGEVTIISPVTLTREESLAMLESILQVRGYTAVPSGKMFKIVALSDAKVAGTQTRTSDELSELSNDDTLITQIVPLERTSVEEAAKLLQNLLPRDASMLLFPPSNTIVLTGRSVNIKRALEVVRELEKGLSEPGLDIVPLKFSSADDMKKKLERIISEGGVQRDEIRGGVNFIADKRSNNLLILSSPDNFSRIRSLIDRLDTGSTDTRPELTKFFKLKYADESETVKEIKDILGFSEKAANKSASESVAIETTRLVPIKRTRSIMVTTRSEDMMTRIKTLLDYLDSPPVEGASDVKVVRVVNAEAKTLAETLARLVQQSNQGSKNTDRNEKISFVAEEHTNSIIMTGPPQKFSHYESILKSLDVMRHQILVEVLISEVSGNLTHNLGIEWNVFNFNGTEWRAFGGTNYDLKGNPLSNNGFQVGLIQDPVDPSKLASGDLAELSKIKAMVKAYQNNSNFKILSAPQILATDNEEANISVGEVVALPQGFTQDRDTGRFDLTNFKYEDVGIVLNITPRVNSNQLVTLKIDQEIKKRQEENLYEFNVPVLTKRQMDTTISVPNHKTIVIGGLMREDKTKVTERVPLLSNIPFIGEAFKNRRTITQKTNLLVFITPHILSSPEELVQFDREKAEQPEEQRLERLKKESNKKLEVEKNRFKQKALDVFDRLRSAN